MPDTDTLMYITDRPALRMVRGEGSWIWDDQGRRYLDFIQGWAVNSLGHCPRVLVDAVKRQAELLITPSPAFHNEPSVELADLIVSHSVFDKVFFTNSGAEANEAAIKLARKWGQVRKGGAYEIFTMEHSFHGRTLATMSASGKPQWDSLFEPKVPGFAKVPLNDVDAVAQAISDQTVAVMLEPIQGEAGVFCAGDEYMRQLRALTRDRGLLLIVDEVQTGVGRTGRIFGYEWSGIEPDIMTLGKGLGGGLPLAALVAKAEVCCFEPGDQGGTYNGNPLVTAGGCAVMREVTSPGFLAHVDAMGRHLTECLERTSDEYGLGEVRGRGLLRALDLKSNASKEIASAAMRNGLIVNAPRPDALRFMPALNVTEDEIDQMAELLRQSIRQVQGAQGGT